MGAPATNLRIPLIDANNPPANAGAMLDSLQLLVSPVDEGADRTGVTDARQAFVNCEVRSTQCVLTPGTYKIASNLTLSKNWRFMPGAVIKPAAGVVVTFSGKFDAGLYQTFDITLGTVLISAGAVARVFTEWYNAKLDGQTDDSAAVQAALDSHGTAGSPVWLTKTVAGCKILTGLTFKAHNTRLSSNGATLAYSGVGIAIDGTPIATVYPQDCAIDGVNIGLTGIGATGIRMRFSHSTFTRTHVFLQATTQTAWDWAGDPNGTGPYYNICIGCNVQGSAVAGQTGVNCTFDASNRAPNTNTWIGGRLGQLVDAFKICGSGNYVRTTVESITGTAFTFNHTADANGCQDNQVDAQYLEVGNIIYAIGANSRRSRITIGFATGFTGTNTDAGTNSVIVFPSITGAIPVLNSMPTGGYKWGITIDGGALGGISFGWYHISPEAVITAPPGSICLSGNGNVYRKGSGSGNTGWLTM